YVLCRNTAPLVTACLQAIRQHMRAFVRGRDIGEQLKATIDKIDRFAKTISEFVVSARKYRDQQVNRLNEMGRETEATLLNDRIETLMVLCEECDTVNDLERLIDQIFSD